MMTLIPSPEMSPLTTAPTDGHPPQDSFCLDLSIFSDPNDLISSATLQSPHSSLASPNNSYTAHSLPGRSYRKRPHITSLSSVEHDRIGAIQPHSLGPGDTESQSSSRKRTSTDAVDYPRKRAIIACEVCRSRKSRCDGVRPKCRLCTELDADCVYREPGIKLDAGDRLIIEHLERIEYLLRGGIPMDPGILRNGPTSPGFLDRNPGSVAVDLDTSHLPGSGTWNGFSSNLPAIPKANTAPALHLLQWPLIRDLVSRPYDPRILLQLEASREPLSLPVSSNVDLSNTSGYIHAFFGRVNVWYACVDPYRWSQYYHIAFSQGFRGGPESCVVLLVCALGNASSAGSISCHPIHRDLPGLQYFAAAWALLPVVMTRNDIMTVQCLVLASAYLFYLVRPLEAWNLLANASMKLQLILRTPGSLPSHMKELGKRIFWNTWLLESDLLAELDLPPSGILQFGEIVGIPCGYECESEATIGRDELCYFLAEISLRQLLNRIGHVLYTKPSPSTHITNLEPLVTDLDFQLVQWYESLPIPVQFPHSRIPLSNPVQTVLRLRYFGCRTVIFRPYVLAVLEDESAMMDPVVQENCRKCLEACIRQLEHVTAHHAGHLPYLWQGTLSMVSQTLLVMGATMSASLAALLPPPHQMNAIIEDVVLEIQRCAHLAPSLRLAAEVIREAEERRQVFLRSARI
ncbi:hypothetical protein K490DRAFT_39333 [Saccharata proteae CBS 121410]|uniref:Zn(2)-C6 fungal-type domain-containing protein n=1 Tax=Saccharata proteae CBS 121410 TaxID=1314787 RepID=A0A9P4HV41_9PEZI|nr:hypothetical protein K490DRAFT_39333 [Saccharata proteae CBS 121410]